MREVLSHGHASEEYEYHQKALATVKIISSCETEGGVR